MNPGRKAIIVASYGTSYAETRKKTIKAIETYIAENFSGWEVRRAFTSRPVIRKIERLSGEKIDFITDALERLISDGVRTAIVQPTLIVNGLEYDLIAEAVSKYRKDFDSIVIGRPLLTTEKDYDRVIKAIDSALLREAKEIAGDGTAVVLMGHGTEHYANASYSQLYLKLKVSGYDDVYVTNVTGFPEYKDALSMMEKGSYKDVVLYPFLIVAGDHANNDLAGDKEDSLKSVMAEQGYNVHCVVKGLGEYQEFRDLFLSYAKEAMAELPQDPVWDVSCQKRGGKGENEVTE